MLTSQKSITLTGQSMIGGQQALAMTASVASDGSNIGNITTMITNSALYLANKTECRKDTADFENLVYAAQDEIASESTTSSSSTTTIA